MKSKKGILIGGLVVAVAFGALIFFGLRAFGSYSYTVSQFLNSETSLGMSVGQYQQQQQTLGSAAVKVHGWVGTSSPTAGGTQSTFTLTDGTHTITVASGGVVAGTLPPGMEVVVQGSTVNGVLKASRVSTTKEVRLEGPLDPNVDVKYDVATRTTRFALTDPKHANGPDQSLQVIYVGDLPDGFFVDVKTVNVTMVVTGREGPNGTFVATGIQTKCASKYAPAPPSPAPTAAPAA